MATRKRRGASSVSYPRPHIFPEGWRFDISELLTKLVDRPVLIKGFCSSWKATKLFAKDAFFAGLEPKEPDYRYWVRQCRDIGSNVPSFEKLAKKSAVISTATIMTIREFLKIYQDKSRYISYMTAFKEENKAGDCPFQALPGLTAVLPPDNAEDDSGDLEYGDFMAILKSLVFSLELQFESRALWFSGVTVSTGLHYDTYMTVSMVAGGGTKEWYFAHPSTHIKGMWKGETGCISSFQPWCKDHSKADPELMQCFDRLVVETGDLLIVPKDWWHAVVSHGHCVAVNWWFSHAKQSSDATRAWEDEALASVESWKCSQCSTLTTRSDWPQIEQTSSESWVPSCKLCGHLKGSERSWRCSRCLHECLSPREPKGPERCRSCKAPRIPDFDEVSLSDSEGNTAEVRKRKRSGSFDGKIEVSADVNEKGEPPSSSSLSVASPKNEEYLTDDTSPPIAEEGEESNEIPFSASSPPSQSLGAPVIDLTSDDATHHSQWVSQETNRACVAIDLTGD